MAVISTGLLEAGLRSDFFGRLGQVQTWYQDFCTRIPSTRMDEKYKWLGSVPTMREWGNGRLAKGLRTESYDVDTSKWENTLEVDRDEITFDQTGQIRIRVQELADKAAMHKDILIGTLLENGSSSGYLSYDGVTFFNAAHSSGSSGSQDNDTTSAAATDTQPTVAEFRNAVQLMLAAMQGFKDDQGHPMMLGASGLKLVVPVVYNQVAIEAMQALQISGTSNTMLGLVQVVPFPYLTSVDRMYLLKTDGVVRPFIFQDVEPITFAALAEGSAEEFLREKYYYGVRARYAIAYGKWEYCVRHIFT